MNEENMLQIGIQMVGVDKLIAQANKVKSGVVSLQQSMLNISKSSPVLDQKGTYDMLGMSVESNRVKLIEMGLAQQDAMNRVAKSTAKPISNFQLLKQKIIELGMIGKTALAKLIMGSKELDKSIKSNRSSTMALTGGFMSMMFFGMQMWRIFSNLFKGMLQTYKDLDKKGNQPLNRSLVKLSASWTFLKFSILDAMSPIVTKWISTFAGYLMDLADMSGDDLRTLGSALLVLAGAGFLLMSVGQIGLFITGMEKLVAVSKGASFVSGLATAITSLAFAAGLLYGLKLTWDAVHDYLDANTIVDKINAVLDGSIGLALSALMFTGLTKNWAAAGFIATKVFPILVGVKIIWEGIKEIFSATTALEVIKGGIIAALGVAVIAAYFGGLAVAGSVFLGTAAITIPLGLGILWWKKKSKQETDDFIGENPIDSSQLKSLPDLPMESTELNENMMELATMATPQNILALKELDEAGTLKTLATSITEDGGLMQSVAGVEDKFAASVIQADNLTSAINNIPTEVTVVIKYVEENKPSGLSQNTTTFG